MRKRSQRSSKSRTARKPKSHAPASTAKASQSPGGFLKAWQELLASYAPLATKGRGRPARVSLSNLLAAMVFHFMNGAGTLAEHFAMLFDDSLNDSSCSSRRTRLSWEVFGQLLGHVLRPLADKKRQPESFWRGWRLVAMDGTQFSVANTPQIKRSAKKAKSRRGQAAFAKIVTGVMLEIGLHNPVAAAIGRTGQSEWELARGLLAHLPKDALLLADRLHGCAAFVREVLAACQPVNSHFLIRARGQIKCKTVKRLKDGSRIVRVPVREKGNPRNILQWLELRSLRVMVQRKGHRTTPLHLWTSLMDPLTAPALELVELYGKRWEHELFYRQLKLQLRQSELLQSHTVETGAQEIAAMLIAAALIASERAKSAGSEMPALRISFVKLLELLRPLWLVLTLGDDLLEEWQKEALTKRFQQQARRCVTPPRRKRSCPRAVRQPVTGWPRLINNQSWNEPVTFKLT